jgi:hypothetical protein
MPLAARQRWGYPKTVWKWRPAQERAEQPQPRAANRTLRWKTYSSETGYVYQYVLRGCRPWRPSGADDEGFEYVFHASRDRKEVFEVSVVLAAATMAEWSRTHANEFRDAERYAIAKLSLLAAFDEYKTQDRFSEPIRPGLDMIEKCVRDLGL